MMNILNFDNFIYGLYGVSLMIKVFSDNERERGNCYMGYSF